MANADISLLFGVLGEGSLSGESGSLIQSQLNQIMSALNKNPLKVKVALDTEAGGQRSWNSQLQSKLNSISASGKFSVQVSNIKIGAGAIADFKKQLNAVINTMNLDKGTSITLTADGIGEIKSKMEQAGAAATDAARKTAEFKVQLESLTSKKTAVQRAVNTLNNSAATEEERSQIAEITKQYEAWATKIEEVRASKSSISDGYRNELLAEGVAIQENIAKLQQARQAAEEKARVEAAAANQSRVLTANTNEYNAALTKINNALIQAKNNQQKWTAAQTGKTSGDYANIDNQIRSLEQLKSELKSGGLAADDFTRRFSNATTSIKNSSENIRAAGENTKTLSDRVGGLAGKFTSWLTISQIIMRAYQALQQMVTAVIDVDTAMTELRKVTDETEATYSRFLNTAVSRAKELGATVSDTVTATADFARLGYNIDEASELADAAIVYKNVGDGIEDISEASESIISTMQAFGIAAEDSMLVVDKFNEVGNNFAISSRGVGEALLRSASALAAGNNTLDESIALVTTANTIVQNPEAVGTTMKTISMYLRAAKTEAEEAGESTEGMANSVSELRSEILALTGNKVDIQVDEDTFKSTYQIIKEISQVWDELTDVSQANILEMLGGKRNSNVVAALIENFDIAESVVEDSANAAGSALAENEKYLDSINGKIAEFKATFQEFSVSLIDSDFVKGVVEFGTGLLNVLNILTQLIDKVGGLNTVLAVTVGIIATVKMNSILKFFKDVYTNVTKFIGNFSKLKSVITAYNSAQLSSLSGIQRMDAALKAVGISASTAQIAFAAFTLALTAGIAIYNAVKQSHEEMLQAARDSASEYNQTAESLDSYKAKIAELKTSIDSGNLSEAEAYDARQQLLQIQSEVISAYGEEAGALDLLKMSADEAADAIDGVARALASENLTKNSSAIDEAISKMEEVKEYWSGNGVAGAIGWTDTNEAVTSAIQEAVSKYENAYLEYTSENQTGGKWMILHVEANAEDARETIVGLSEDFRNIKKEFEAQGIDIDEVFPSDDTFAERFETVLGNIDSIIDQYGEIYEQQIVWKIAAEPEYSTIMDAADDAKEALNEAITNTDASDEDRALAFQDVITSIDTVQTLLNNTDFGSEDSGVREYLQGVLDELNELASGYVLEIELETKLKNPEDSMSQMLQDAIDVFKKDGGTVDPYEILNIGLEYENSGKANNRHAVLTEEEQAYVSLKFAADQYGITVEELISLLSELGYASSTNADAMSTTATSYDSLSETVTGVISNIESAQKMISSQANGQSISLADFNAEGMEDYRSALEYVNGTMQLNADKVREITEAKAEEQIAINETNKALAQAEYIQNARQIEEYRRKLADANFENGETAESVQNSIDALLQENSTLADTCKQYDLLTASLREAVGAYQNWLNAQSASDYGDMEDDAVSAIQNIRDTYDSESDIFGNFGSRKFDAAIEFIIPDSVDRDDLGAIESYMADFQSYLRFDDDGNVDGLNIDEFLRKSVEAGLMNYSDENGWTVAGQTAMEDFAEGLGLSMGVVQAFFDELQLKGAEFDWSDETVKTFGDLAIEATEAAEALRLLEENEDLEIKLDVSNLETTEEQLSALDETIAEMNEIKARANVDSTDVERANAIIQYCIAQKQLLSQPDVMRVDTTQCEEDIASVISLLQEFQSAQNTLEIKQSIGADTTEAESDVAALVEQIQALSPEVKASLGLDTTSAEAIQESINGLTAEAIVTFGVDASAITGYDPETKTCDVVYNPDTDLLPESFDPMSVDVIYEPDTSKLPKSFTTIRRKVEYYSDTSGIHGVNGTAHASGTAKAGGDWGTAVGGETLVGELGREIVVDPHTGRWYTVGDNGAEFVRIPAGSIVFNHKQTESLLEHGYVSGRASALVSGTAMVTGGYKPYVPSTGGGNSSGTTTSNNNNNSSATLTVDAELDPTNLEEQLEDTLDKLSEEIDEVIGNFEHKIFLLEKNGGSTEEIVAIYRQMQEAVHEQAEKYRALGLDDNSDYIQDLQKQWWDYQDSIQETIVSSYEAVVTEWENAIELTENLLEKAINNRNMGDVERYAGDIIAYYKNLQAKVHEEAEYYRSLGYSDTSEEISALSNLWWEYGNSVIEVMNRIVETSSDAVDQIQDVYDILHNAANEYADGGYVTVDTLQDIINMGVQYMQLLTDENGQLVINEERINAVIAARTEQLALESAINYVERLRLALQAGSIEELNNLLYATTQTTNATWGLVYANLALLDLDDSQYQAALHNINALRSLAQNAISGIGQVSNSTSEALEEMKTGLDDILKYVMEMLKQRINDQIEALEDMKSAYRDIIDLRKEALDAAKEESDYQDEVADKVKEIAKLQERINALSLDDSRDAQSQKAQLEEEMYELQNELADKQSDYAMDAQKEALDDMAESYEAEKDKEIAILEDSISSYQKLYDMAISYIESNWDTLYNELIAWNTQYGTELNSTITEAWNNALAAAQRYGSYVSALNNIGADIDSASGNTHNDTLPDTNYDNSSTNEEMVTAIVYQMKQLGKMWDAENNSQERNDQLHEQAAQLAARLDQYGVHAEFESPTGIWWITKDELNPSNVGKQLHSCYHDGGIAGDNPTLKQNEVLAVLEKGEAVLDEQKEKGLFRLIDFATSLSDAFSSLIDSTGYDRVFSGSTDNTPRAGDLVPINNSSNSVQFGDVYIYGANDETVKKHQEINRKFTNEVLKNLNIKSR